MTRTVKRIVHVVAFVLASQVLPFQTDAGQGAYTMMVAATSAMARARTTAGGARHAARSGPPSVRR